MPDDRREPDTVHDYGDGKIQTRTGRVNRWLLVVYALLALWSVYYLVVYWGGLGPGLAPPR